jgi:hypothetical protein
LQTGHWPEWLIIRQPLQVPKLLASHLRRVEESRNDGAQMGQIA